MTSTYTLITGGLGGLGSTFAYEFASQGTDLILVDRQPDAGEMLRYLTDEFPVDIRYYACDLSDPADRASLVQDLDSTGLHFNGLVNVVGQELEGLFLTRTREEVLYMLHLNLEAMIELSHFALNRHDPTQRFLLINVASLAGFFPIPHKAVYSATKRFIIHFSLALREEVRDFANVTVLCPGGLPTNPEAMKKIFLQGFWGKMTAHDTYQVVRRTIQKARKNCPVYTPGLANRFLLSLARIIPAHFLAGYLSNRWAKKQTQLDYWRVLSSKRE